MNPKTEHLHSKLQRPPVSRCSTHLESVLTVLENVPTNNRRGWDGVIYLVSTSWHWGLIKVSQLHNRGVTNRCRLMTVCQTLHICFPRTGHEAEGEMTQWFLVFSSWTVVVWGYSTRLKKKKKKHLTTTFQHVRLIQCKYTVALYSSHLFALHSHT